MFVEIALETDLDPDKMSTTDINLKLMVQVPSFVSGRIKLFGGDPGLIRFLTIEIYLEMTLEQHEAGGGGSSEVFLARFYRLTTSESCKRRLINP